MTAVEMLRAEKYLEFVFEGGESSRVSDVLWEVVLRCDWIQIKGTVLSRLMLTRPQGMSTTSLSPDLPSQPQFCVVTLTPKESKLINFDRGNLPKLQAAVSSVILPSKTRGAGKRGWEWSGKIGSLTATAAGRKSRISSSSRGDSLRGENPRGELRGTPEEAWSRISYNIIPFSPPPPQKK